MQDEEEEREAMDGDAYDPTPFEPFRDLCKRRFLWYYDSYLVAINGAKHDVSDGQNFARMPFEGPGNEMMGKFNYTELERRLHRIKRALDTEVTSWAKEGLESKKRDSGVAANLQRQFEQIIEAYKKGSYSFSIELLDGNPFTWMITYFGRPMTVSFCPISRTFHDLTHDVVPRRRLVQDQTQHEPKISRGAAKGKVRDANFPPPHCC